MYLTEKELVEYIKISPASIRRLVRNEAIPYVVIPLGDGERRTIRFSSTTIDKWMGRNQRSPIGSAGHRNGQPDHRAV